MQCIIMEKHSNQITTPWWNKEKGSWLTDSQSLRKPQVEPRWVQLQISIIGSVYMVWNNLTEENRADCLTLSMFLVDVWLSVCECKLAAVWSGSTLFVKKCFYNISADNKSRLLLLWSAILSDKTRPHGYVTFSV